jgi:hypothetical protein
MRGWKSNKIKKLHTTGNQNEIIVFRNRKNACFSMIIHQKAVIHALK